MAESQVLCPLTNPISTLIQPVSAWTSLLAEVLVKRIWPELWSTVQPTSTPGGPRAGAGRARPTSIGNKNAWSLRTTQPLALRHRDKIEAPGEIRRLRIRERHWAGAEGVGKEGGPGDGDRLQRHIGRGPHPVAGAVGAREGQLEVPVVKHLEGADVRRRAADSNRAGAQGGGVPEQARPQGRQIGGGEAAEIRRRVEQLEAVVGLKSPRGRNVERAGEGQGGDACNAVVDRPDDMADLHDRRAAQIQDVIDGKGADVSAEGKGAAVHGDSAPDGATR